MKPTTTPMLTDSATTISRYIELSDCAQLSNKDLYALCKQYGKNARKWTRKFAALLPEVLKRGLHKKYGYQGINEFAAKLCGMSTEVVERILLLHKKLVDKPLIWEKLEVFGWTKLLLVARVVERDTQKFWLDKLERLTYRGLAEYVQVWKRDNWSVKSGNENLFEMIALNEFAGDKINGQGMDLTCCEPENDGALRFVTENLDYNVARPHKSYKKFKFNLDKDTEFRLKNVKKQLEKERGAVTFGETLNYVLKKLEELEAQVESVAFEAKEVAWQGKSTKAKPGQPKSAKAKALPKDNHQSSTGDHQDSLRMSKGASICCAYPGCNEPYDEKHHPFRSSLSLNNKNLAPLCRKHHQLAHSGLIENEKQPPSNWRLQTKELPEQLQYYLDRTFTAETDLAVRRYLIDS